MGKLIIDGNSVYEIDDDCIRKKEEKLKEEVKEIKKEEVIYKQRS